MTIDPGDYEREQGTRSDATDGEKFFEIMVKQHKVGVRGGTTTRGSSYLRLGTARAIAATDGDTAAERGDDLAELVTSFVDDTRDRGEDPGGAEGQRAPGNELTLQERRDESAILLTKGGWRDHSDGNRVTTTRGDKVEVIQGNYKLVVLGRQGGPEFEGEGTSGFDWSGGDANEGGDVTEHRPLFPGEPTPTPEERQGELERSISWNRTRNGWNIVEKSETRGETTEETWAFKITENKGRSDEWIDTISESTFASTITENTLASTITENKGAEDQKVGSISENTFATHISEETHCDSHWEAKRVYYSKNELAAVGLESIAMDFVGILKMELAVTNTGLDVFVGLLSCDVKAALLCADIAVTPMSLDIIVGNKHEIVTSEHAEASPAHTEVHAQCTALSVIDMALGGVQTALFGAIHAIGARVDLGS